MRNQVIMGRSQGAMPLAGNQFRQKYIDHAEALFPVIAEMINEDLPEPLFLTTILEPQLKESEAWHEHPSRLVAWDWRTILHKFRKKPRRLDVAFYCREILCGLMTASISRGRVSINVRYVEASPDKNHPLKRNFLFLALRQAELFAVFSKCKTVSVSQPNPILVNTYKALGYGLVESDRKREERQVAPRHALLVKDLREASFDQLAEVA